jgi:O-methyltransferase
VAHQTRPVGIEERTPIVAWQPGRREPFTDALKDAAPDFIEGEFWKIAADVWDYTCISLQGIYSIYSACRHIAKNNIPGDVVECGVFFGGSIMVAAQTLARHEAGDRRIVGLDTFHGFLRRSDVDIDFAGEAVCHPNDLAREWSFRQIAENNIGSVSYNHDNIDVIEGDVFETLKPATKHRRIAILRLDTDTYDTTKFELEACWDRVVTGGIVIIDDYGWCQGARKATDEFLDGKSVYLHRVDPWIRSITKL